ncbi:GAL4 enhancer protein [Malassezia cuniculi]|uniref:Nascent polypeptide-associated complex subunit alpha n=1 Tax=Malassezia cuniculi TaxID=948313 RepID=A0AAF0EUE6_9BASI|nr:GAL4 enhancer protein [Malassezia cuniculi]
MSNTIEEIREDIEEVEQQPQGSGDVTIPERVQSRAERKSRKSMQGIGLKQIPGIKRVTLRRPRGHLFVVSEPDVYKSSVSDVYVIFGEVKSEDTSALAQAQAAQQLLANEARENAGAAPAAAASAPQVNLSDVASSKKKAEEEEDDGEPIDETGVDAQDIELVIEQVGCSRRKAVKALKESEGDLINAIMSIS